MIFTEHFVVDNRPQFYKTAAYSLFFLHLLGCSEFEIPVVAIQESSTSHSTNDSTVDSQDPTTSYSSSTSTGSDTGADILTTVEFDSDSEMGTDDLILPPKWCNDSNLGKNRPMVIPRTGDLKFTELMPRPAGADETKEWLEVYVEASYSVDLNGLVLSRKESGILKFEEIISDNNNECLTISPGEYILFARSSILETNEGDLKAKYTFDFFLIDEESTISLAVNGLIIDEITYSEDLLKEGRSLSLDLNKQEWCKGKQVYHNTKDGNNYGSPATANPSCPMTERLSLP